MVSNYIDFEEALSSQALRTMVLPTKAFASNAVPPLFSISRRLVNLLCTCRLYLDQTKGDLSHHFSSIADAKAKYESFTHEEYDARLGYRAMEAMRNFSQHQGLLVHQLNAGTKRVTASEDGDRDEWAFTCTAQADPDELRKGDFKPRILDELVAASADKKWISLVPLTRSYASGLSSIHEKVRALIAPAVKPAEELFKATLKRFADAPGEKYYVGSSGHIGLAAVKVEDRRIVEQCALPQQIATELEELDCIAKDLDRSFVTSRSSNLDS